MSDKASPKTLDGLPSDEAIAGLLDESLARAWSTPFNADQARADAASTTLTDASPPKTPEQVAFETLSEKRQKFDANQARRAFKARHEPAKLAQGS